MAVNHMYVDAITTGAGNDYAGTSFTDGTWNEGTLTLTKTGAFTAATSGQRF